MSIRHLKTAVVIALGLLPVCGTGRAQVPPSAIETAHYSGLFKAAFEGNVAAIELLVASGAKLEDRDSNGRTPFLTAAYAGRVATMERLAKLGADVNAFDGQAYDAVTIAAVADDVPTLKMALKLGNKATNITSPYTGTALIAAAHLGHAEVVQVLIEAGAPLDHVNNLGWTALIEAVVLGDGGPKHQATVAALAKAGANRSLADNAGLTPLQLAEQRGYETISALLRQ